ncbi:FAD-dependent oxidoreductase [Calothrix sp. NIES-3974]|uniref:FAD-dependent oxidoreductase n=1 Tax=Calothrix sp. NIES-3974 TaxID=2005462 RepID=UPI000B616308|nr:FAD-dependent oxidoreductase [Calothrix sp. NIES-3974]BAZ05182.1 hypothetical protein NIES3974_18280 [Calothrix sp. NIES-3974]
MPEVVRNYDIICFGDEVPGILTLVTAAREFYRRTNRYPHSLVMFKGNSLLGVGGHLVRGGLAYIDRSVVPRQVRDAHGLGIYGQSAQIYEEFLNRAQVAQIALDARKGDQVLREMLREVGADILSNVEIKSVIKQGKAIAGIALHRGETYMGQYFIDATVNAELAQFSGVEKQKGFATFGLPNSELSVTLTFETEGISVSQLKDVEMNYMRRFADINDREAQKWIQIAAGGNGDKAQMLREPFVKNRDNLGNLAMYAGRDYIDVRSDALSIAYHAFRDRVLDLRVSKAILDRGNIAVFADGRMSWNALLFDVNADQAENLARNKALPTPEMNHEFHQYIVPWFQSLGATRVTPAPELYIRRAGNIVGVNDPLTGVEMLQGGVPASEAIGTFGYHFDIRGGIAGLGDRAAEKGLEKVIFMKLPAPLFNVGIQHTLLKDVPNLSVISPASGFEGYASSAGRIVEFNAFVGQGVGVAIALSMLNNVNLNTISNRQVRDFLAQRGLLSAIYGQPYGVNDAIAQIDSFETGLAA